MPFSFIAHCIKKKKNTDMATGEAKQEKKTPNTLNHLPSLSSLLSASLIWIILDKWAQSLRQKGWIYPRNKEYSYKKKKKGKKSQKQWLTRWRELNACPCHSSVYFHRTSTLVCVMTTLSTEERGNFRLPARPVSGKTCWSGNRVQEHGDTPLPPPPSLLLVD